MTKGGQTNSKVFSRETDAASRENYVLRKKGERLKLFPVFPTI